MAPWFTRLVALVKRWPTHSQTSFGFARGAGMVVNHDTALQHATFWACVRLISETIATLGWHINRISPSGDRERLAWPKENIDWLLNNQANPEQTAFAWREQACVHALMTGNHYTEIERDNANRAKWLWPLDPMRVDVQRDPTSGALRYIVTDVEGGQRILSPANVLHIHGLGWDGVTGYSVLSYARRTIGIGLAMDQFGASFYENGTHLGVMLEHPSKLSDTARERLENDLKTNFSGSPNAFKAMVLEEGTKLQRAQMSMIDAQFLESRRFQVAEICRWFRVPLHKVQDLDRATFSNIEHQAIEFVTDAILPWARRFEQEIDAKLFGLARQGAVTTRLNIDTLLRGDIASRYTAYEKGRLGGWLSANDVRKLENLNAIPNGDRYLEPLNYHEAGEEPPAPEPAAAPAAPDATPPKEGDGGAAAEPPSKADNVIRRTALAWARGKG